MKEKTIGFMILAARQIHLTAGQEEKLDQAMAQVMSRCTEQEAIEAYRMANGLDGQELEQQDKQREWNWKSAAEVEKEAKGA